MNRDRARSQNFRKNAVRIIKRSFLKLLSLLPFRPTESTIVWLFWPFLVHFHANFMFRHLINKKDIDQNNLSEVKRALNGD